MLSWLLHFEPNQTLSNQIETCWVVSTDPLSLQTGLNKQRSTQFFCRVSQKTEWPCWNETLCPPIWSYICFVFFIIIILLKIPYQLYLIYEGAYMSITCRTSLSFVHDSLLCLRYANETVVEGGIDRRWACVCMFVREFKWTACESQE